MLYGGEKVNQDINIIVRDIMIEFADLTGLSDSTTPNRYLWTDSFAVCNFLELYQQTSDDKYKHLALRLVDQVHNTLGRHREDDRRTGWISGLNEQEGKPHPTKGGLRIGKKINERKPSEPFDESLEWERDGQYYHYLTKWMHALNRVTCVTGNPVYNIWAMELAKTAHAAFTYVPSIGGQKRMYWKMSIDLSYPLVPSMGHHDPLDGFITYSQLQSTSLKYSGNLSQPDIVAEIADMAAICEGKNWVTDDPLGIGDLLCNAQKTAQLIINSNFEQIDLLHILLGSSLQSLKAFLKKNPLELPAYYRLAFRELGLSIGIHAVEKLKRMIEQAHGFFTKSDLLNAAIEAIMSYMPLSEQIETFWLYRSNREAESWTSHREINMVMLATSLAPDAYLIL
jgi:hypothetical protein